MSEVNIIRFYFLVSLGQILNKNSVELLSDEKVYCFSSFRNIPVDIKAKIIYRPTNLKEIFKWFASVLNLLRKLKGQKVVVYTPHLGPFLANILKNSYSADVVFVSEGMLDKIVYKMDANLFYKSIILKIFALFLGLKYKIYKDDLRDGRTVDLEQSLVKREKVKAGNNILIATHFFFNDSRVDSNLLVEIHEEACRKIPHYQVFFKPHPKDTCKKWPGKIDVHILHECLPAEWLIEKYNIGIVVATHSSVLVNVKKIFGDSVRSVSVGINEFVKSGILSLENVSCLQREFMLNNVETLLE